MKRREFFRKSMGAGVAAGAALTFGSIDNLFGRVPLPYSPADLVAVKGGSPGQMFDLGIEALGGIEKFVKPNQTVVVKPNIGWDRSPEQGANTNPLLVKRIVEHCIKAGAKKVLVFDHTCDVWTKTYKNSGIEKAVKDAGGKIVPGNTAGYYHAVNIPKGVKLTSARVHELILESDVFINVPVLKHHSSSRLTASMKNLMGIVWDRRFWHRNDLQQCIADFATYERKPDLNVIDAYNVMMRNGPQGVSVSDVVNMKTQILTTDMVAADAAAAKFFGSNPSDVPHIRKANEMGVGEMDLEKLSIKRIMI